MATEHFDTIIIGAGQGGMPLSRALAGAGRKTAIIERTHVGCTCINEGCTPTKTMVASARVAYLARRGADYGVQAGLESGQLFRRFGRRVTVVQHGKRLLTREDGDIAEAITGILREDGIEVLLETEAARVEPAGDGGIKMTVRGVGGGDERVLVG